MLENQQLVSNDCILLPSWYVLQYDRVRDGTQEDLRATVREFLRDSASALATIGEVKQSGLVVGKGIECGWHHLGDLIQEVNDRIGSRSVPILSCSKLLGIIWQSKKFNRRIASSDVSSYKIVQPGEFAFDPMLLWDGSIGRNNYETAGAVSPVYVVFRVKEDCVISAKLLEILLRSTAMRPKYESISLGTNMRRRKVVFSDFAKLTIPVPVPGKREQVERMISAVTDMRKVSEVLLDGLSHNVRGVLHGCLVAQDNEKYHE